MFGGIKLSMVIYRTFWKERGNSDNFGEGNPVVSPKQAQHICDEHNKLYPRFRHWVEKVEFEQSDN